MGLQGIGVDHLFEDRSYARIGWVKIKECPVMDFP
jgi:hypothetical protein